MQLLGRQQRKASSEITSELVAEDAQRTCPRAICFLRALRANGTHEIEILPHASALCTKRGDR